MKSVFALLACTLLFSMTSQAQYADQVPLTAKQKAQVIALFDNNLAQLKFDEDAVQQGIDNVAEHFELLKTVSQTKSATDLFNGCYQDLNSDSINCFIGYFMEPDPKNEDEVGGGAVDMIVYKVKKDLSGLETLVVSLIIAG